MSRYTGEENTAPQNSPGVELFTVNNHHHHQEELTDRDVEQLPNTIQSPSPAAAEVMDNHEPAFGRDLNTPNMDGAAPFPTSVENEVEPSQLNNRVKFSSSKLYYCPIKNKPCVVREIFHFENN